MHSLKRDSTVQVKKNHESGLDTWFILDSPVYMIVNNYNHELEISKTT
jgi:hypothetical protein